MLGKLGDLVGELYLAETEKKKNQLWQRAQKAMEKLNIPQAIINHITEQQDVEILAKNLQDWQNSSRKKTIETYLNILQNHKFHFFRNDSFLLTSILFTVSRSGTG